MAQTKLISQIIETDRTEPFQLFPMLYEATTVLFK
jgi:hypothetical protein